MAGSGGPAQLPGLERDRQMMEYSVAKDGRLVE
jgi:hypothetical protein